MKANIGDTYYWNQPPQVHIPLFLAHNELTVIVDIMFVIIVSNRDIYVHNIFPYTFMREITYFIILLLGITSLSFPEIFQYLYLKYFSRPYLVRISRYCIHCMCSSKIFSQHRTIFSILIVIYSLRLSCMVVDLLLLSTSTPGINIWASYTLPEKFRHFYYPCRYALRRWLVTILETRTTPNTRKHQSRYTTPVACIVRGEVARSNPCPVVSRKYTACRCLN